MLPVQCYLIPFRYRENLIAKSLDALFQKNVLTWNAITIWESKDKYLSNNLAVEYTYHKEW